MSKKVINLSINDIQKLVENVIKRQKLVESKVVIPNSEKEQYDIDTPDNDEPLDILNLAPLEILKSTIMWSLKNYNHNKNVFTLSGFIDSYIESLDDEEVDILLKASNSVGKLSFSKAWNSLGNVISLENFIKIFEVTNKKIGDFNYIIKVTIPGQEYNKTLKITPEQLNEIPFENFSPADFMGMGGNYHGQYNEEIDHIESWIDNYLQNGRKPISETIRAFIILEDILLSCYENNYEPQITENNEKNSK